MVRNLEICLVLCFISCTVAVEWPQGTYTLVKSKFGCPQGWLEGYRYQDNEDKNENSITPFHHFEGKFGKNMQFHYCTRDAHSFSSRRSWPSGDYCILKHGRSCPRGFHESSVYWDDEDSNNANSHHGTLPSGVYDKNTRIYYCCRRDGPFEKEIQLPTSKPFYLLRFASPCQKVKGMHVREETVRFDDEDRNNANSVSGRPPMGAGGKNHRLMYCYYCTNLHTCD